MFNAIPPFAGKPYLSLFVLGIILLHLIFPPISFPGFDPSTIIEARICNIDREDLIHLVEMDLDIDGVIGDCARIYVESDRLNELKAMGYQITVPSEPRSDIFKGYHTFSEVEAELKIIEAIYPGICRLYTIGKSFEGRDLWFMKVSDNVEMEEDEPEVKLISTIHGDEPVGMELCLKLLQLLTEGYGIDPRITHILDNIELWIMPLMNPDGYANQSRKSMEGKDLNRSFPDRVADPYNTVDGRPIEIRALMEWAFLHTSILSISFHAGALVVNYPYDSDPDITKTYSATPDDDLFIQLSLAYSSQNSKMFNSSVFDRGITNGIQWYPIYGGMQDWNYVWLGCNEVTVELSDTKWPPITEIEALWIDNREAILHYIEWSLKGIRGIMTDGESGQPINAIVRIDGIDHDVFTDPDVGDYHRLLLPGTYDISFRADGYVGKTATEVIVHDGNATRLDIELYPVEPGDINADGLLDLADGILSLQTVSSSETRSSQTLCKEADVNGDGMIGLEEAIYILRRIIDNILEN